MDLWPYLRDSLSILQLSLKLARQDHPEFYRVAAVQLRLMLCDTTRRHQEPVVISLAPRLLPGLALHPLVTPGPVGSGDRVSQVNPLQKAGDVFNRSAQPLSIEEWLDQSLGALTIRQLIRRVCDQDGGAHVDPRPSVSLPEGLDYRTWILVIGEYVVEELLRRYDTISPE